MTWRVLLIVVISWWMMSCSYGPRLAEPIQIITEHPRLMYRSLDPTAIQVDGCPTPQRVDEPETPHWFLVFPPDRWNLAHGDASWRTVYEQLDHTKPYALIGHARSDEAGAALVAQRRANVTAQLLIEAGFPHKQLRLFASWGNAVVDQPPRPGVLIVPILSRGGLWRFPQTVHHSSHRTHEGG